MNWMKSFGGLLLTISTLYSADYYVSPGGDDGNNGTAGAPFKTIAKASLVMTAGDTCYLRAGTYRETITPVNSGTDGNEMTYQAYQNELVEVTTSEEVTGWSLYQGAIYQTAVSVDLGEGLNQVFVDGKMVNRARWPNTGSDLLNPTLAGGKSTASTIAFSVSRSPDYWVGGTVYGAFDKRFTSQGAVITASTADGLLTVDVNTKTRNWYTGNGKGYITGVFGELDAAGEWFIKDGKLYLWAPGSVDPSTMTVEIKQRRWCADLSGKSYIKLKGLKMTGGPISMNGTHHSVIDDCELKYLSHFTRYTWGGMDAAGGIADGHNGIWINGDHNVIQNCVIENSAGSGVVIYGGDNLVTRNIIRYMDYSGTYSCPLSVKNSTGNNKITFNTMTESGRDIIQLYGTNNDQVMYNDLSHAGRLTHDLGITYQWGRDGNGTRIAYNWVHDNHAGGPGIYHDNYCTEFITDHNVIWNCQSGVRHNRPTTKMQTYNNTLFNCNDVGSKTYNLYPNHIPSYWRDYGYGDIYDYVAKNNLFLSTHPESELVDYVGYDFRLKVGSLQIDSGVEVTPYTNGFIGAAPDKGAYEAGYTRWTAGHNGVAASPIQTPTVQTLPPGGGLETSATLNGTLTVLGTNPTAVWVYWGERDGGGVAGNWDHAFKLADAVSAPENYTHDLTGLTLGKDYFYRFYAVNSNGESWGDTVTFHTSVKTGLTLKVKTDLHIAPNGTKTTGAVNLIAGNAGSGDLRTFIQFDMTAIPAGKVITKATLKLYHIEGQNDDYGNAELYGITSSWDNSSVSYNQPIGTDKLLLTGKAGPFNQYIELDVTSLVKNNAFYGLSIRGTEGFNKTGKYFAASEGGAGKEPLLEVEYSDSGSRSMVFNPSEDLFILPNGTKTTDSTSLVAGSPYNSNKDQRIFIKFDTSNLPAGSKVTKATLRLYHIEGVNDNYGGAYVYNTDTDWNSAVVTYAQSVSGAGVQIAANTGPFNSYVEADVTALVLSSTHFGFSIRSTEGHTLTGRYFDASEGANKPELVIDYSAANTPALGLTVIQKGDMLEWNVQEEYGVKAYHIIDSTTRAVIEVVEAEGADSYAINVPAGIKVELKVVDENGSTQTFIPEDGSRTTVDYKLTKGWNLIAAVGSDSDFTDLKACTGSVMWGWDGSKYVVVDEPEANQGLWVYSTTSHNIRVQAVKASATLTIKPGWSLIGPSNNVNMPDHASAVFSYNAAYNAVLDDHNLLYKGVGYWVFVTEETEVTVNTE